MNVIKGLQYVIIGKFSYEWPDLENFRLQLPKKLNVKGGYNIGLLRNRHILMRFNRVDDFATIMSKSVYFMNAKGGYSYQMCPFIYNVKFKTNEETTQAMAWISFSNLKPKYFMKESLFSLVSAIGKSIYMDMATVNKMKPSCTRIRYRWICLLIFLHMLRQRL